MGRFNQIRVLLGSAAIAVISSVPVAAQTIEGGAFTYEERSTIDNIPLRSLEEESLADTAIDGGLEAPAPGVPVKPRTEEEFYLDPLALQPRDRRTDLGRTEIPVTFRFADPREVPGQTRINQSLIVPQRDTNRTIDSFQLNTTPR